jgi:4Fe-4S ferredoxin
MVVKGRKRRIKSASKPGTQSHTAAVTRASTLRNETSRSSRGECTYDRGMSQAIPNACKPEARLEPVVDHGRCEGKRDCVEVCPYGVFEVRRIDDDDFRALSFLGRLKSVAHKRQTAYTPNRSQCQSCGLCVKACPEKAIQLRKRRD